jgi:hypothetical protein
MARQRSEPRLAAPLVLPGSLLLLAACAAVEPTPPGPPLELVVERTLPMPTAAVADCLRDNARRVSYPRGQDPFVTTRVPGGEAVRVEQWFDLGRHGYWMTRYELLPAAGGGTEVRVFMDTQLTLARGYARTAQELVAYCAGR